MKDQRFKRFYWITCIGVLIASWYPLFMGIRVMIDMIVDGAVLKENYPKYIIPYTPISLALLLGVVAMPWFMKHCQRFALLSGSAASVAAFFVFEFLFEQKVIVTAADTVVKLEDWQMYMCYVPPGGWGESEIVGGQTAIDILMGEYNPAFKLHFYIISIVLILTILNCLYGFGHMIREKEIKRKTALILQSTASAVFLGLCILACFTAFWRDGSIQVSALSASLMAIFFILLGVTLGIYTGSFLLGKRRLLSVWLPAIVASVLTLLMYVGEMILLNGHLYRFGTGYFFDGIPGIVLAPVDLVIIVASGCMTAATFMLLERQRTREKQKSETESKACIT